METTGSTYRGIPKCPTGIRGLDSITEGGLPRGRPTLVCGGAGSGKTLLAMEFIVRGIREFDEPGVFVSFEETAEELTANVASLGFDLGELRDAKKLVLDYVRVERSEIEETGTFDLEGLFVRLGFAIDSVQAKRVAIDSLEALFVGLPNEAIVRAELRRLFNWLKQRGLTAIITGEQGERTLTRHGLEEYVSDCVIALDHRMHNQMATRRLRIAKYRGTHHGTNEYPTTIDEGGLSVLPISALDLKHRVTAERVSTGLAGLDEMLDGKGFHRGSSVLVSGAAGTGKSSFGAAFVEATCARGERAIYFSFEESPAQVVRNMGSVGIDLERHERDGRLHIHAVRTTCCGLEQHLVAIHKQFESFAPHSVVLDPVTSMTAIGERLDVIAMLTRAIDFLKSRGITSLFLSLTHAAEVPGGSDVTTPSLMDTWIDLRQEERSRHRVRSLTILKSRGTAHSSDVRDFHLGGRGIQIAPSGRRKETWRDAALEVNA